MDFEKLQSELERILQKHTSLLHKNYNGKKDQILLEAPLVQALKEHLNKHIEDDNLLNATLKTLLREIFDLQEEDLLIFKNGIIFIKLASTLPQKIQNGRKDASETRFNGYDEKELIAFYNQFFTPKESLSLIKSAANEFVQTHLLQNGMGNEEYEKKVFAYLKEIIYNILTQKFDNEDEFLKGFAGYFLRINFEKVFRELAEILLEKIAFGEQKIVNFLEYYSHEVIIINGEKYTPPPLMNPQGFRWKLTSIRPIVRIYVTNLQHIREIRTKIAELKAKMDALYKSNGSISLLKRQRMLQESIEKIEKEIRQKLSLIERLYDEMLSQKLSKEKKKELKKTIELEKNETEKLKTQMQQYQKALLPSTTIMQYKKLYKEYEDFNRELKNKFKILEQNRKNYEEIRAALVKALIQKKKKIG